jgi:phage baseplate assembly protein W
MSNLLDRFKQEVTGSEGKLHDFLPKITSAGDFQKISNLDVIISSWNNILITPRRTHMHDPEYGSDLHLMIFQPVNDQTIEEIKTEIEYRIQKYDNRASIEDVEVRLISNKKGFEIDIIIDYDGDRGTLSVRFDGSTLAGSAAQGQT